MLMAPVLEFPDFDRLRIVKTDAFAISFGAVSAQIDKNRFVHPIHFANRMMTKT